MISRKTAQQIVDTVKDVCGYDINFINENGIVLASTDPSRIGSVHEGGRQAAFTGQTLEVKTDGLLPGTKKGVNIPVFRSGNLTAVIGISGDPDQVQIYAHLAERITLLILREQELGAEACTMTERRNYLLHLLIEGNFVLTDDLERELCAFHIDPSAPKRMIAVRLCSPHHESSSAREMTVRRFLEHFTGILYSFQYPASFTVMIDASYLPSFLEKADSFLHLHPGILQAGIGSAVPLNELEQSLSGARIALSTAGQKQKDIVSFDDLTLDVLLNGISQKDKALFIQKILSPLSGEDLSLLRTYFEAEQSLTHTCDILFMHKNTLQYRLNKIFHLCGLNPRSFRDAVVLYLALELKKL